MKKLQPPNSKHWNSPSASSPRAGTSVRASEVRSAEFGIRHSSRAFTLIEILVSVAIMTMCMALVAMIYTNTIKAWRLGQNVMDELHQGDFVMEQLVTALRSEAFFVNNKSKYGFWLDDQGTQSHAHDEVSFVTSSSAFIPSDSPLQNTLHRLFITIGSDKEGRSGLSVRALPHMMKEMDKNKAEPWIVSSRVKAFDCQVYNSDTKSWDDDWEDTNKIPPLIKVTLTIAPVHEDDPDLVISRVVEIPIAPAVTQAIAITTGAGAGGTNAAAAGTQLPVGSVGTSGGGIRTPLPTPGTGRNSPGSGGTRSGNNAVPNPGGGGSSTRNPTPLPPSGTRR